MNNRGEYLTSHPFFTLWEHEGEERDLNWSEYQFWFDQPPRRAMDWRAPKIKPQRKWGRTTCNTYGLRLPSRRPPIVLGLWISG